MALKPSMNKKIIIHIIVTFCLACFCNEAYSVKAISKIIKIKQPDGSFLSLKVRGDEKGAYYTTKEGFLVAKKVDGFFYYATSADGAINPGTTKVSDMSGYQCNEASMIVPRFSTALHKNSLVTESAPGFSFIGNARQGVTDIRSLVLLVQFSDIKFSTPYVKSMVNNMLNLKGYSYNGATGSVADYFNDNFNGKVRFSFDVSDIITLKSAEKEYGAASSTLNDINPSKMIADACAEAQNMGIDFSKYDTNSDGKVDNVFVVYAGYNQAEGADPDTIWPHYGDISSMNISYNGVSIGSYGCTSELKDYSGEVFASIGTFCHEFAHSFGLVDLYDTNYEVEGKSMGMYENLSIMDAGNYLNQGNTPPYFSSIEKEIIGISPIKEMTADKKYTLPPVQQYDTILKLNTSTAGEYFLFECRRNIGWDKYIGGEGLVVYHIDKSGLVYGGIESAKRWIYNNVNAFASHECAKVFSASGSTIGSISGIFYPGTSGKTSISSAGEPPFVDWSMNSMGLSVNNITFKEGVVSFYAKGEYAVDPSLPKVKEVSYQPYQNDCRITWKGSSDSQVSRWHIIWRDKNTIEYPDTNVIITEDYSTLLSGLLPAHDYEIKIQSLKGNFVGESFSGTFKTQSITSMFPYMNLSGVYKVGDVVDLKILNLNEQYSNIKWTIDGVDSAPFVKFQKSGNFMIEAQVTYLDKTIEIFKKRITVK